MRSSSFALLNPGRRCRTSGSVCAAVVLTPEDAREPTGHRDDFLFGGVGKRNVEKFVDEGVEAFVF